MYGSVWKRGSSGDLKFIRSPVLSKHAPSPLISQPSDTMTKLANETQIRARREVVVERGEGGAKAYRLTAVT